MKLTHKTLKYMGISSRKSTRDILDDLRQGIDDMSVDITGAKLFRDKLNQLTDESGDELSDQQQETVGEMRDMIDHDVIDYLVKAYNGILEISKKLDRLEKDE